MTIKVVCVLLLLQWRNGLCAEGASTRSWLRSRTSKQDSSNERAARFPSVEKRVQLYMGNWYLPPCNVDTGAIRFAKINSTAIRIQLPSFLTTGDNATITQTSTHDILNAVDVDRIFFLEQSILSECANSQNQNHGKSVDATTLSGPQTPEMEKARFKARKKALILKSMRLYCADAISSLIPVLSEVTSELEEHKPYPPLLVQFGDLLHSHIYRFLPVPHFKKFRQRATKYALDASTRNDRNQQKRCLGDERRNLATVNDVNHFQPIIWKLGTARHYGTLPLVEEADTPWESKKPLAIFRGQLTGSLHAHDRKSPDEDNCMRWTRCRVVYTNFNSTMLDAKLTSTRHRMPNTLNGVELVGKSLSLAKMLEHKAIVMLEGNDVASGLKWALLSQSVVLMPPPTFTSWAMEELLEPWVHYIPLNEEATDIEEKMNWVLEHDQDAQKIAQRGSLWIHDLCFHPDATRDDRRIQEEMVRRFLSNFNPVQFH